MYQSYTGVFGKTVTLVVTDTVQVLDEVLDFGDNPPIGILVSCEENAVRCAFRVDPTATFGHVLKKDLTAKFLSHPYAAKMRVINDTAQSAGVLMITPLYEAGKYS